MTAPKNSRRPPSSQGVSRQKPPGPDWGLLLATPQYIVEKTKLDRARRWCSALHGHVIDIGCGYSPYRSLLTKATRYTGVEAATRYKPDVVTFVYDLPFADASADSAMLTEVLEHLAEPEAALRETARVLKPGGALYVTVPMTWGLHYVPHDYYRFTRYGISYLLQKAGFEVEAVEPMGGLFTIISARLAGCVSTIFLDRPLRQMGIERGRLRLCAIPMAGYNLAAFYGSRALDRCWKEDVFGWSVLARKK